jgi:hypothetical protein
MRNFLPIFDQPMPIDCAVAYSERNGEVETSIARVWHQGEAIRCTLCPLGECTIGPAQLCLIVVRAEVPAEDAWLFARRDTPTEFPLRDDPRWFSRN